MQLKLVQLIGDLDRSQLEPVAEVLALVTIRQRMTLED